MEWLGKHADALMMIGTMICCMIWMNGKFNGIDSQFAKVDQEIAVMKTVLIMKNIMPNEMAHKKKD